MKLIVGLGNPGAKYASTWHNLGFLAVDSLAERVTSFRGFREKDRAEISQVSFEGESVWLMKPQTFMNLSGEAVGSFVRYHGIEPEEVLVVHDDLDLELSRLQIKKGGGSAGHNGLESIFQHWGKDFYRLRVGIGKPPERMSVSDYVLKNVSKAEILPIVESARQALEEVLNKGVNKAVASINVWPKK